MKIILGLGNPGKEYARSRHNAGFLALNALQKTETTRATAFEEKKRLKSEIATGLFSCGKILLAKPLTFMNDSGEAAQKILSFYKAKPEDLIVIHDDVDLPVGVLKIRRGGSSAGHKGIDSIIAHLGTNDFYRVRMGVHPKSEKKIKAEKFVLKPFTKEEEKILDTALRNAADAVLLLCEGKWERAMNLYNRK